MSRRHVWGPVLAVSIYPALALEPLSYEEIVRRERPAVEVLERRVELARLTREVASTGGWLREPVSLSGEVGARRVENGANKGDAGLSVELPLLSDRGLRTALARRLEDRSDSILAGERVEARLRLRLSYLDAWLGQEIRALRLEQVAALEGVLERVNRRAEAGAVAEFETAIVEGELLRTRAEADEALAIHGTAWAALRTLADLPASPVPLAAPGAADVEGAIRGLEGVERSALRRASDDRRALAEAIADFEGALRRSRWAVGGGVAVEGDERAATVTAAYRFPFRAETGALERERTASVDAARRTAEARADALATRLRSAAERAAAFGEVSDPTRFDSALRAVLLRIESGKDLPTDGLLLRRRLLEAKDAAFARVRDAHAVVAEIEALTAREVEP